MLAGRLQLAKMTLVNNIPPLKQNCKYLSLYSDYVDVLVDQTLTQMLIKPTRYGDVLGLFLTDNSTLVNKVEIMPDL